MWMQVWFILGYPCRTFEDMLIHAFYKLSISTSKRLALNTPLTKKQKFKIVDVVIEIVLGKLV